MGSIFPNQRPKKISVAEGDFSSIKDKLCLDNENIQDLFQCFRIFDRFDRSYIDFDDFIIYFRKDIQNFIQLPYAERLFRRIPKSQENKIYFQEFVEGISAFCLLNNQSILHFIFDYIDEDGDERISKADILKLIKYTDPKNGKETFFTNFSLDLEQFPIKQNQNKMDFDHFRLNSDRLLFLIWPAFSLQDYLRQKIMGTNFWIQLYTKVQKKQIQIKNNEKKQQKIKQKLEILKHMKIRNTDELLFKDKINERKKGEINDDCKMYKRYPKQRRRSTVYIKEELQINNIEQMDQEK